MTEEQLVPEPGPGAPDGRHLAETSDKMVQLQKQFFGKAPTSPHELGR
jgi:hypothetical protein